MKNISQGIPSLTTTDPTYTHKSDEDIAYFIRNNGAAIGYIGYPSFVTKQEKLRAVVIQMDGGNFVSQSEEIISSSSYSPLSRKLYMSVRRDTLSISRYFLEFAYSNYGNQVTRSNGYTDLSTFEQFQMLAELGSIIPPSNCGISLGNIECCMGAINLKIFVVENTERHFIVWKIYFEAACPSAQITLINNNIQNSSVYFRACKISTVPSESDFLDIAATGSKLNNLSLYPVSDPKFINMCTKNQATFQAYSPTRSLVEFTMAPSPERFFYTNSASSARSRTRCFLEFAICNFGTLVMKCNGLSFNDFPITTGQMCSRNRMY
jgi:hypothetical protein